MFALAHWHFGFWVAQIFFSAAGNGVFGIQRGLLLRTDDFNLASSLLMVLSAALIAGGIVTGAVAERAHFVPLLPVSAVLAGLLIPLAGLWVWGTNGWLRKQGFHDGAGAAVVHLTGGLCAAIAVIFVGPRDGKYNRDGSSNAIPGHNVPIAGGGVLIMFIAWALTSRG